MSKLLGLFFFLAGLGAIYYWGIRPLVDGSSAASNVTSGITITARGTGTPAVLSGDERSAAIAAGRFLQDWQAGGYGAMYDLLSSVARKRISRQAFVSRYEAVMDEATVQAVHAVTGQVRVEAPVATVSFTTALTTTSVGLVQQTNQMRLLYEHGAWGVDWYPALIFKQLDDPYVVHLVSVRARRGSILDRHGVPLAEDGQFESIGVVPGLINDEALLLQYLSGWLHMDKTAIKHLYTLSWAQPDFFMPITTITKPQLDAAPPGLTEAENDGMVAQPTPGRIYPQGSLASNLIGYVNAATQRGVTGLERSLDGVLSGTNGAQLLVMNRAHTMTAATIATRPAIDGKDVRLTLDLATQRTAEKALGIHNGAAVAIQPATGQVLALVSSPGFDPNRFEVGDTATSGVGPVRSLFPRATLGTYPIGSIFKIVTMAAALEHGGYGADTLIDGPGVWYGLGADHPLHDWLASGHGTITLQEALTQSCDTCFYEVAKQLDHSDVSLLPHYARAFGFGSPTGIDYVAEAPGLVGDDAWKRATYHDSWRTGDTVNMAIGQGYFLATPLQVAAMLAAVADGGIRHTPQLILMIGRSPMPAHVAGTLPVSALHLRSIVRGMVGVTAEATGTANFVFNTFSWTVAGKTGTAQNPGGNPHAWFGAVAPADHPRIALALVVENGGEGSLVAAPKAKAILQTYLAETAPPTPSGPQQLTVPAH